MSRQIVISVPLDIPNVRLLRPTHYTGYEYILTVESTVKTTTCHRCGRTLRKVHDTEQERTLRHLPILGHPVYVHICPKRFRCPVCDEHPITTQQLNWYDPNQPHTIAYEYLELSGSTPPPQ